MAFDIHKAEKRDRLPPRVRDPYWREIVRGRAVGFRKVDAKRGFWIARMRPEDGGKKYEYEPLGEASREFDWAQAKEAAEAWFKQRAAGVGSTEVVTVSDACREYVAERRKSKSDACAHDAHKRFERTVYGRKDETGKVDIAESVLGRTPLAKVTAKRLREWRDGLGLSAASVNRTLTALKAALNLAVAERHVSAERAQEWDNVPAVAIKGGAKRRNLFLDRKQRRALLGASKGALRDLLEGAALTGARAGELVNATVSQFNPRTREMTFAGKTGARTVLLPPAALRLFARLAKDKAPDARLFTRDDGKPWAHSDWDEHVRAAAEAAKLPTERGSGVCLYTLRHSFITENLRGGMATLEVARFVGTSLLMIEKHYGHVVGEATRQRMAKVAIL